MKVTVKYPNTRLNCSRMTTNYSMCIWVDTKIVNDAKEAVQKKRILEQVQLSTDLRDSEEKNCMCWFL